MATPDREESTLFVREQEDPGDDDDDISLTSTVGEDADDDETREYNADCILAERPTEDEEGAMQYLVKWEGKSPNQRNRHITSCLYWPSVDGLCWEGMLWPWAEDRAV